jgi:hypothetical protein
MSEPSASSDRFVCPKCGHKRTGGLLACPRCGLRFALWRPSQANLRAVMPPIGEELWWLVEASWQDQGRHEAFIKYCLQSNLLPAAGRCYREHLDRFPGDAIATKMQAEILTKASLGMMVQQRQAAPSPFTRSKWFWAIMLAAMAAAIATAFVWVPGRAHKTTPPITLPSFTR